MIISFLSQNFSRPNFCILQKVFYLIYLSSMGTKKKDKEFLWLKVLHLLDDMEDERNVHKKLKALNKTFFLKERIKTNES